MVQKYKFGKERYMKQINYIWEWQKIMAEFGRKRSYLKESGVTTKGRKEVEVSTLLIGNDKNKIFFKLFIY